MENKSDSALIAFFSNEFNNSGRKNARMVRKPLDQVAARVVTPLKLFFLKGNDFEDMMIDYKDTARSSTSARRKATHLLLYDGLSHINVDVVKDFITRFTHFKEW